jgi:hypothetical protein
MVMHELRQAYRGGIWGDNDTFGGPWFVVEKAALEADLLWVGIDKKWLARHRIPGALSAVSRAGLAVRSISVIWEICESLWG